MFTLVIRMVCSCNAFEVIRSVYGGQRVRISGTEVVGTEVADVCVCIRPEVHVFMRVGTEVAVCV